MRVRETKRNGEMLSHAFKEVHCVAFLLRSDKSLPVYHPMYNSQNIIHYTFSQILISNVTYKNVTYKIRLTRLMLGECLYGR